MPNRFRADLVDVAWGEEETYGKNPIAGSPAIAGLAITPGETALAGQLWGQWGLVTGGVDLPTPTFEWAPFFGVGVQGRNMLFPIQGRERLEGRLGGVLFCHDSSRLFMEQCLGIAFNGVNRMAADGTAVTAGGTTLVYTPTTGSMTMAVTSTSVICTVASDDYSGVKPADNNDPCKYIVIFNDVANSEPDRLRDTWAYVGFNSGNTTFQCFRDRDQSEPGFNGPQPPITSSASTQQYSFHSIERAAYNTTSQTIGVTADRSEHNGIIIRPTLVQPSFMIAARFRADDGSNFVTNYKGCKVARVVFNFDEGAPVNYGADFIAREFRHNIGEDTGTGSQAKTNHYAALQTTTGADVESHLPVVVPPNNMKNIRVTEQPYFFSRVMLTFQGVDFARFRRFSLTVDNQLDPRYYLTQNTTERPREGRQVLHEILEGRRNIGFSGSLDLDDTGLNTYPASSSPTDAQMLRYLLNQGFTDADSRDQATLRGIGIRIELRRTAQESPGGAANATYGYDKVMIYLPSSSTNANDDTLGQTDEVGMILRSVSHNIPAPPSVHIPVDIDGFCSSMHMEFLDNVGLDAKTWTDS